MGTLRDGPTLAVDHMILFQMLSDPQFFTQVPLFHYLRAQALAVTGQIVSAVAGERQPVKGECPGCLNMRAMMAPLMLAFVTQLRQIVEREKTPELLEPLAAYLAKRRNYRPRPIVVYYRGDGGRIAAVRF